jgi:hypothetical protein
MDWSRGPPPMNRNGLSSSAIRTISFAATRDIK